MTHFNQKEIDAYYSRMFPHKYARPPDDSSRLVAFWFNRAIPKPRRPLIDRFEEILEELRVPDDDPVQRILTIYNWSRVGLLVLGPILFFMYIVLQLILLFVFGWSLPAVTDLIDDYIAPLFGIPGDY